MTNNGVLDWWRNATPEQKEQRRTEMAAERAVLEAKRDAAQAEYRERAAYGLSTEGLNESIAAGDYGVPGGVHPRQAVPLLRLATVEQRQRALAEASTRQNLMGGNLSGQLYAVVPDLLALVAAGREGDELYGERTARQYRERDNEARDANLRSAAAALAERSR